MPSELNSGDSSLILSRKVELPKPFRQRYMVFVHDCSLGNRGMITVVCILIMPVSQRIVAFSTAFRATKVVKTAMTKRVLMELFFRLRICLEIESTISFSFGHKHFPLLWHYDLIVTYHLQRMCILTPPMCFIYKVLYHILSKSQ